jgi:hypothetical protein
MRTAISTENGQTETVVTPLLGWTGQWRRGQRTAQAAVSLEKNAL